MGTEEPNSIGVKVLSLSGSERAAYTLESGAIVSDLGAAVKDRWGATTFNSDDGEPISNGDALGLWKRITIIVAPVEYAIKTIPKRDGQRLTEEVVIMRKLDHPNIIKLVTTYADKKNLYLVLELCTGGELFDRVIEEGHFKEHQARNIMRQLLKAVEYCHSVGVCHRCPKPEDILMVSKEPVDKVKLKLCDFGMGCRFTPGVDHIFTTKCGTPYYVAPQILAGRYDEKCDIWCCGVIMYVVHAGYPPFFGETDAGFGQGSPRKLFFQCSRLERCI